MMRWRFRGDAIRGGRHGIKTLVFFAGLRVCCLSEPALDAIYPAGGNVERQFEVEVCGSVLEGVVRAKISGEGVKATFAGKKQVKKLNKKGRTIKVSDPDRLIFKVVIENDAHPGLRMIRLVSASGLSEPLGFEVSAMPEQVASAGADDSSGAIEVDEMPVCLNGRILDAGGERYAFCADQGSVIVAQTVAEVLPFNGFVPHLRFYRADGKLCEGIVTYDQQEAPVAVLEIPEDGKYELLVTSFAGLYGNVCVYRIRLGELPLITGFTPDRAVKGESLNVRLTGHNLPRQRVRLFTGGKNSVMCLAALTEGAYYLPALNFMLDDNKAEVGKQGEPDFVARMTPASLNIPAGGRTMVSIYLERLNGFDGEVRVRLDYPPLGITSETGIIPPGQDTCLMAVLTDSHRYPKTVFDLDLAAEAKVEGRTVRRGVIPSCFKGKAPGDGFRDFAGLAAKVNPAAPKSAVPKKR